MYTTIEIPSGTASGAVCPSIVRPKNSRPEITPLTTSGAIVARRDRCGLLTCSIAAPLSVAAPAAAVADNPIAFDVALPITTSDSQPSSDDDKLDARDDNDDDDDDAAAPGADADADAADESAECVITDTLPGPAMPLTVEYANSLVALALALAPVERK